MIGTETLRILEYERVLAVIAGNAHSDISRERVAALAPLADRNDIETRFGRVAELRTMGRSGAPLRFDSFADIAPVLDAVRPVGAVPPPVLLADLIPILTLLSHISRQLGYRTEVPLLRSLTAHLSGFPDLLDELKLSLDEEGNILDSASRLLAELRGRKKGLTARIRRRL
jgi:DNA mismatch repair protein MutS2